MAIGVRPAGINAGAAKICALEIHANILSGLQHPEPANVTNGISYGFQCF